MTDIARAKNEAWKFYNKWRKEKTFCPALNTNVSVSLKGWRHISGATGHKKRTPEDTFRRFKLLPCAKEIIEKATLVQDISKRNGSTFYVLEGMVNVKEVGGEALRKVRVIIIEDKLKNKIFYSVMDKKRRNKKIKNGGKTNENRN